jgi:hypothetical protein
LHHDNPKKPFKSTIFYAQSGPLLGTTICKKPL